MHLPQSDITHEENDITYRIAPANCIFASSSPVSNTASPSVITSAWNVRNVLVLGCYGRSWVNIRHAMPTPTMAKIHCVVGPSR